MVDSLNSKSHFPVTGLQAECLQTQSSVRTAEINNAREARCGGLKRNTIMIEVGAQLKITASGYVEQEGHELFITRRKVCGRTPGCRRPRDIIVFMKGVIDDGLNPVQMKVASLNR